MPVYAAPASRFRLQGTKFLPEKLCSRHRPFTNFKIGLGFRGLRFRVNGRLITGYTRSIRLLDLCLGPQQLASCFLKLAQIEHLIQSQPPKPIFQTQSSLNLSTSQATPNHARDDSMW